MTVNFTEKNRTWRSYICHHTFFELPLQGTKLWKHRVSYGNLWGLPEYVSTACDFKAKQASAQATCWIEVSLTRLLLKQLHEATKLIFLKIILINQCSHEENFQRKERGNVVKLTELGASLTPDVGLLCLISASGSALLPTSPQTKELNKSSYQAQRGPMNHRTNISCFDPRKVN